MVQSLDSFRYICHDCTKSACGSALAGTHTMMYCIECACGSVLGSTHAMTVPVVQSCESCHDCTESAHGSVLGFMP